MKLNIEVLLKIESEKASRICLGKPITLQSKVTITTAKKIQQILYEMGLKVHIVENKSDNFVPKVVARSVECAPTPPSVKLKDEKTVAKSDGRLSTKTPELPKANSSLSLSFSQDYIALSEGHNVESEHGKYEEMMANAPVFELISYEESEGNGEFDSKRLK